MLPIRRQWLVPGILLIAFVLRVVLVFRGGQYYFPDEVRYENSWAVAGLILQGRFLDALALLTNGVEHIGFRTVAVIPALLGHLIDDTPRIPALFFGGFSVLNVLMIWMIARRAGRQPDESFHALWLAATCQSLLYFSRHLLPYDLSMLFALAGLLFAIRPVRGLNLLACGALSSLSFMTYNGYWSLAGFTVLFAIANMDRKPVRFFRGVSLICLGFIAPLLILYLAASLTGNNIAAAYQDFASSVNQGDYSEGWILPFEYIWQTEHLAGLAIFLLGVYAAWRTLRRDPPRIFPWVTGAVFIYLCLFIPSVGLQQFVVYGRLARQMIPFLLLIAAMGLTDLSRRGKPGRIVSSILIAIILAQSAWSYRMAWSTQFPREFIYEAAISIPGFRFSSKRMNTGAPSACRTRDYLVQNVKYIFPLPDPVSPIVGRLLKWAPHPVNFLPYQYEGYTREQRDVFRSANVTMSILEVDRDTQLLLGPIWSSIKNCYVP
ncbi:MAG: hypothetical protein L0287_35930 [Anaerolineae bacterium]|nr:hypothetical protein [Anaerolineae bacterium]